MKVLTAMDTIVASRFGHVPPHCLNRDGDFRDNSTYNIDSYLDEADMNS